ncbi:dTDP-4-dehydrorhamnose reductase [Porphyromonas endodontalis]|uniref:dTDP-4-dehydrorhamnose reductase n=1 Tax=Porphyromonas endodontalis TaxID=28124 RepID=UPI002889DE1C|nr:dTDP-4-dehydrorhamnose reductase [Porphyromonas endodontalis]
MKKKVLVTGANGQLGNEFRRIASTSSNCDFIFTDVIAAQSVETVHLDILDVKAIEAIAIQYGISIIINCAAYTNVDAAEEDIDRANALNNIAVRNLATVTKSLNINLIHISTDYVFNGNNHIPYRETETPNPIGVYGKTKADGERSLMSVGCKYLIFRTSWLYSKYGKNFVKTMQAVTATKDSVKVVFDQIGSPTYAGDLADTIYYIISTDQLDKPGVYHFSNEGVASWYDFALEISNLFGNVCDIQPCHSEEFPSKVKRPHFSVLDKSKIKETFCLSIPHWKESLKVCINELNKEQMNL